MYELNRKIAESIDQIDGAEVTNKGQYNQGKPHCDIDFTYDNLIYHIDLKTEEFDGQSFFEKIQSQMNEIDKKKSKLN